MPLQARIKKVIEDVELPQYQSAESAGFDLASAQDAVIEPNQIAKLRTGLIIEAPEGHFLLIAARSSLGLKKGLQLANSVGVVDRDYAGPEDEIHLLIRNITTQAVEVKKGERLAQGLFVKVDQVKWRESDMVREQSRGGIGSTGGYSSK
jgi:dUTP pyrophosphatase